MNQQKIIRNIYKGLSAIVFFIAGMNLIKEFLKIENEYIGRFCLMFVILSFCLSIILIVAIINTKEIEWSQAHIQARIVSSVIVIIILLVVEPQNIFGDAYKCFDSFYITAQNAFIIVNIIGLICDSVHILLRRKLRK